ncbi:hypothetical protein ACWDFL_06215 [Streptomyces bungoensis]
MTEPGLFELETVVVGQPKRSRWRSYVGPALAVSTVNETPLAWVTYTDDTHAVLTKTSGELIVRIEQRGSVEFRFTDPAHRLVGTAGTRRILKTLRLTLQAEEGRQLLLTRPGVAYIEWHLTEAGPEGVRAQEVLGQVTVSTIDSWIGLQQYVVQMGPHLNASERRTVIASVVCLHRLRRPPGDSSAPV